MKTVIMAGGNGSRIADFSRERMGYLVPKPLLPINGIPILEREIAVLRRQGFIDIIITVGYLAEKIIDYFGDGSLESPVTGKTFGVNIEYYIEDKILGNAGALFNIKNRLTDTFLLLNADEVFDVDLNRFLDYHFQKGGLATVFTHPNDHPYDSGLIIANKEKEVIQWLTKDENRPKWYKNRVNAGIHVLNKKLLNIKPSKEKIDLDRDILKPLTGRGGLFCYDSPEYIKDTGTRDRFLKVENDIQKNRISLKNLENKQRAIFLDRDGVINKYRGFITDIDEFELISGVTKSIKEINCLGYLIIVITNQPVIARGDISIEDLEEIHNKMETLLGEDGAYLDGVFWCPHHPDAGYEGEISELKIKCECRKPKPGLLLKAADIFNIDLAQSWMVGDGKKDIEAGKNAGCKTCLLQTTDSDHSQNGEYGQDLTVNTLSDFIFKSGIC